MRKKSIFLSTILSMLLITGFFNYPIIAEDPIDDNQIQETDLKEDSTLENEVSNNDEDETTTEESNNDSPIILRGPVPHDLPQANQSLMISFSVSGDIEFSSDDLSIEVFIKPFEDYPINITTSSSNAVNCTITSEDSDGTADKPKGKYVNISLSDLTKEGLNNFTIFINNLYPDQEYSLSFIGQDSLKNTITYLCRGGVVKNSAVVGTDSNTINCIVHDSNNPDSVTNPGLINTVRIDLTSVPEKEYKIPIHIVWEHLKGSIAQFCANSNGYYESNLMLRYTTDQDSIRLDNNTAPGTEHKITYKDINKTENGKAIIEYNGKNVSHYTTNTADYFETHEEAVIPLRLNNYRPGINTVYVWDTGDFFSSTFGIWKIELNLNDNYDLLGYKIYQIQDENGQQLASSVEVNEILLNKKDKRYAQITVMNSSPSKQDEDFEYEIKVTSKTENSGPYKAQLSPTEEERFQADEWYSFKLKHNQSIYFSGFDAGSEYVVRQKTKEGFSTIAASEFNSREIKNIHLVVDGSYHSTGPIELDANVIYRENPDLVYEHIGPPCRPVFASSPINYALYWSNQTEDDFKIKIRKYQDTMFESEDIAEATLEGAKFALIGIITEGDIKEIKTIGTTDENGELVFSGLDPSVSYVVVEIEAPKGYLLTNNIYYYQGTNDTYNVIYDYMRHNYSNYTHVPIFPNGNGEYIAEVAEIVAASSLIIKKVGLLDETRFDGPLFELKHFIYNPDNNDPREVEYRNFIWSRSFFENLEGVEFEMTLDGREDDPRYTYRATTNSEGLATFERVLPKQEGEIEGIEYLIFYGHYTIKEINTPEGKRKMEDQHIEFDLPSEPFSLNPFAPIESRIAAVRVVNVEAVGDLTISKQVKGADTDKTKDFKFTINLKDNKNNPLENEYKYEGSKQGTIKDGSSFTLKDGESITIKNLPAGSKYEVIEEIVDNYTCTINNNNTNSASGEIQDNKESKIEFINTIKEEPKKEEPPKTYYPPKTGVE